MKEEWRTISVCDRYEVSNFGNIRRADNKKARNPSTFNTGRRMIGFGINGKISNFSVYSLVCEAFIGPRPAGAVINHKDGNKTNDRLDNLEYVSQRENSNHYLRDKHKSLPRGVTIKEGRYCAQYMRNGRKKHIGLYDSPEQASQAYLKAIQGENRYA